MTATRSLGACSARSMGGVFLALFAFVGALLISPSRADAAGSVQISQTQVDESDGRWKLKMTMDYGSKPHVAHVPMIFVFTKDVHYERALTDESPKEPILNRIPLNNQQPVNESMDVGFSDGTGELYQKTKFNFVIRRDRGFEAGEYTLKIKRSTDGVPIGRPIKLVLKGENPVMDRRAIVFVAPKKGKKKEEPTKGPEETGDEDPMDEPIDDGLDEPIDDGMVDPDGPPPVEPKQGGCGCHVIGTQPIGAGAGFAFSMLMALGWVARRSRRV